MARGHVGLSSNQALFLKCLEVTHYAVGRIDAELLADFPHGRPVASAADLASDKVKNFALSLGKLVETHKIPLGSEIPSDCEIS